MAKHLARIHGTEEDKVNCPFYFKIGACRHSDRCSRIHHKPAFSPTILIKHLYRHPVRQAEWMQQATTSGGGSSNSSSNHAVVIDKEQAVEDFLCFFEDLYVELSKFGRIEALHVVDNLGDHMIGHVYCKFSDEEEASDALQLLNGRYYDGRRMEVEFSPVTDFREARCRDYDEESCSRGGFCNFLHVKPIPLPLIRSLEDDCEDDRRRDADERRERERRERKKKKRDKGDSTKKSSHHNKRSRQQQQQRVGSRSESDSDHDDDDNDDHPSTQQRDDSR